MLWHCQCQYWCTMTLASLLYWYFSRLDSFASISGLRPNISRLLWKAFERSWDSLGHLVCHYQTDLHPPAYHLQTNCDNWENPWPTHHRLERPKNQIWSWLASGHELYHETRVARRTVSHSASCTSFWCWFLIYHIFKASTSFTRCRCCLSLPSAQSA